MTIDYKALGAKIKEYRKKENITQKKDWENKDKKQCGKKKKNKKKNKKFLLNNKK